MNPAARNGWIDTLRAVSALSVVLFHLNVLPLGRPASPVADAWHWFWSYGHLGVGILFFLSGYCLIPGWSRSPGAVYFLLRRFSRILPPYWCSLVLVVLLAGLCKLVLGTNDVAILPRTARAVLATGFLLTDPVTGVPAINWVYWTLSCIAAFYLIVGTALLAPGRFRVPALAGWHLVLVWADFWFQPAPTGLWFFVKFWPAFGLGAALAVWSLQRRTGTVMLAASLLHALGSIPRGTDNTHYVATACCLGLILPLLATRSFPGWLKPVAWLGTFSYSIYLIHVPVGIYGLLRLFPDQYSTDFSFVSAQLVLIAGVLPLAYGFYLLAERPFLPALKPSAVPLPA